MKRRKSREGDESLIRDETANVAERASAIFRLAVDGYFEMEAYLSELLNHSEYMLRSESIKVLLGGWGKEKYLGKAIEMLHNDPEYSVRSDTTLSLSEFINRFENAQKHKKKVLRELIKQLQADENSYVQSRSYENALKIIENKRFGINLPDDFDRERDINWELLKQYM